MAFYPYFDTASGTVSNDNTKLYLSSAQGDGFDIYKFEDDNGTESLFLLFIIKNTHVDTSSELNISSIVGNDSFDRHFDIDPVAEGTSNLVLGFDSDNKAILPASITNTGTGASSAPTSSSGASAYIGHNGSIGNTAASGINANSSSYLIPIYKTSDIIENNLGYNQYCSFLVKFTPISAASNLEVSGEVPQLYIRNNDTDMVINFEGRVINELSYYGVVGTATKGAGTSPDSFSSPNTHLIADGDEFDIGVFPTGYDYGATNKTIKFYDFSEQPGNFNYRWFSAGLMRPQTNTSVTTEDVTNTVTAGLNASSGNDLYSAFLHPFNVTWYLAECASNSNTSSPFTSAGTQTGLAIYKNFSLGSNEFFKNHPSNIAISGDNHNLNLHAGGLNNVAKTGAYIIGRIENTEFADVNADDIFFQFGVRLGFYYVLTFSQSQCNVWKDTKNGSLKLRQRAFNVEAAPPSNTSSPRIASSSTTKPLSRLRTVPLNVFLRYNYWYEGSVTGDPFTIPSFNLHDNSLVSSRGGSASPSQYSTGGDITQHSQVYQSYSGTAIGEYDATDMFNSGGNHGNMLGLHYSVSPKTDFFPSDMYPSSDLANSYGMHVNPLGEGDYGLYNTDYTLKYNEADGLFQYIVTQSGDGSPKYKMFFWPEWSYLRLLAGIGDGVKTKVANTQPNTKVKLFYDAAASTYNQREYSMNMEKVKLDNPDDWYPAGATAADQNMQADTDQGWVDVGPSGDKVAGIYESGWSVSDVMANEGQWYGAGIVSILRPHQWDFDTGRWLNNASSSSKGVVDHSLRDWKRYGKSGDGEKRWYEDVCDYWFKMPAAGYDASVGKFRAAGRLYMDNTGDYPIFIHNVECKTKSFEVANRASSNEFRYQATAEALLPKSYDPNDNTTQVFADYVPDPDNSATPTWGVSKGRYHGDQEDLVEVWKNDDQTEGIGYNSDVVVFPQFRAYDDSGVASMSATWHYLENNNSYQVTSNFSAKHPTNNSNERSMVVEPQVENDRFTRESDSNHGVKTGSTIHITGGRDLGHQNYIDVVFELTPTGTSSYDNGMYYAQVLVSYYVNDYDSRYAHYNNDNDNSVPQYVGQRHNAHKRLRVSKYLVGVQVDTLAEITVVDSESDEISNGTIIDLGNISVG